MRKPFYWKQRKTWYFRYKDASGRLCTVPLAGDKKQAYDRWREILQDFESEDSIADTDSLSVVDVIHLYTDSLQSRAEIGGIAKSTVGHRLKCLADFSAYIGSELNTSDLRPYHVDDWLDTKPRWNATTRHHAAETIKTAFKWAFDRGRISSNPIRTLKVEKGPPRDFIIDAETFALMIDGASDRRHLRRNVTAFKTYLILLRLTGCRPSEPCQLLIENVDGDTWTLPKHKTSRKKPRPRVIYLCPCAQTLTRILAEGRKSGPLLRPGVSRPWKYSDVRRRFERLRKRKGIDPKCVLYSHRHTWITNAMIAIGDVATVAEMAGTSIQMIERHYGHLSTRRGHMMKSARKIAVGLRDTQ